MGGLSSLVTGRLWRGLSSKCQLVWQGDLDGLEVLQRDAECCSVLQFVAMFCSLLQCVAVCVGPTSVNPRKLPD